MVMANYNRGDKAMTNGLFNDIFVQAEVDYRRDRALAGSREHRIPGRARHHAPWRRTTTTTARHSHSRVVTG
jgi:hypothetical protein